MFGFPFWLCAFSAACVLAFAAQGSDSAQILKATAKADKPRITIGESLRYTITVTAKQNVDVDFSQVDKALQDFVIRDSGSKQSSFFSRKKIARTYILTQYDTGTYDIKQPTLRFKEYGGNEWKEYELGGFTVEVETLLKDENPVLRDIKGPFRPMRKIILAISIAIVLAIIGFMIILNRNKKKTQEAAIPAKPAHEIALWQLQELRKKELIKKGLIKEFYFEISFIIRSYLENRFGLRAPEMTTEEFLASMQQTSALTQEHRNLLADFLSSCDLVKFARYIPQEREIESIFDRARLFIEQTKPDFVDTDDVV